MIKTQEYHFDLRYHRRYIEGIPEKSRRLVSQRPKKTPNQLFDEEDNLNYIGNNLFDWKLGLYQWIILNQNCYISLNE